MSKIEKLQLISDRDIRDSESNTVGKELPHGIRWCYSFFDDELESESDAIYKFSEYIRKEFLSTKSNIYLYLVGSYGWSSGVKKYYKLWKYMRKIYMLDNFILGNEYEISFGGKEQYCGIAQLGIDDIDIAIEILYYNEYNSFIYATNDDVEIYSKNVKSFFQNIIVTKYKCSNYDYIKIYNHIKPNENIISIASDGEGVALHVSEVY